MSEALTFGNVPHPPFQDRLIPDAQNAAWDPLGARRILGCCQHTMVGSLNGTDQWFRRGAASTGLTDYGIGGTTDGPSLDGVIYRWNDPTGKGYPPGISPNRWPWASGPTTDLEGDGGAFVQKYGSNAVNGYLVSVERSDGGNPDSPPSDKYLESFAQLMAYFADQAQCPYDQFPILPASGLTFHYWHLEFSPKTCPNPEVCATADATQQRVRDILKSYQTVGGTDTNGEEDDPLADFAKSSAVLDSELVWPNYGGGKVSKAWAAYGARTGAFPKPAQPWGDLDQSGKVKIYCFSNGVCFDEQGALVVTVK